VINGNIVALLSKFPSHVRTNETRPADEKNIQIRTIENARAEAGRLGRVPKTGSTEISLL